MEAQQSLKEKTAKGLMWGGISNGIQQLLGMLFGIILARTLNAEDYGLVGMLAIFSGIATTIITSGFTVALANEKEITDKAYSTVFWFTVITSLSSYLILFGIAPLIAHFYGRTELISLSRVLFLSFIFAGIAAVPHTVLFKRLMTKVTAVIDIIALAVSGIIGITLAIQGYTYWAIAWQSVVFISLSSLLKMIFSPWRPRFIFDLQILKRMFPFSSKLFLTNIFTQINNNIFSVLLGKLFNAAQVGFYTQGNKWMTMGNSLLNGMINGVAQPVLVEVREDKERQMNVLRKMIRFSAFLSFPAMLGLAFIAPEFIQITIGEKWMPSVPILQLLCIMGAISPIALLYTQLLITHGKSNLFLYGNVLQGVFQLVILLTTAQFGILWMVRAYVTTYFLFILYWHYYAHSLIGIRLIHLFKDILPYVLITAGVFLLVALITQSIQNIYGLLLSKITLSAILYSLVMWYSQSVIFRECLQMVFKNKK